MLCTSPECGRDAVLPSCRYILNTCPNSVKGPSLPVHKTAKVFSTKALRMSADFESFSAYLQGSNRILALLGAGLSASSGLPTFRGAGGLWRTHDAMSLATPEAFHADPALVWQFYSYRRHMSLQARPNKAHLALAELARKKDGFMTLSQNVDGNSNIIGYRS